LKETAGESLGLVIIPEGDVSDDEYDYEKDADDAEEPLPPVQISPFLHAASICCAVLSICSLSSSCISISPMKLTLQLFGSRARVTSVPVANFWFLSASYGRQRRCPSGVGSQRTPFFLKNPISHLRQLKMLETI